MERPQIQPRRSCPLMSGPGSSPDTQHVELGPSNPFYNTLTHNNSSSQALSSSSFEFVWAPPTPDPGYWENVARARDIRRSVAQMKAQLSQARHDADIQRLSADIRASERRLMKHVDRHILSYDDVVEAMPGDHYSRALGTVSPPTSPSLAPDRPLPPTPTPHFASGALPPTPPTAGAGAGAGATIAALGSQAFINSYKKGPDCQPLASEAPAESSSGTRKPAWASLFGSKSVRLAGTAPPADRVGLPSPVSPRHLHAA
ncbi:hypothetical protein H4R27_002124 [Coemansia aciculifera]|nr:hypothetical protein H4R27_002124 [Coemansia aciculifera]